MPDTPLFFFFYFLIKYWNLELLFVEIQLLKFCKHFLSPKNTLIFSGESDSDIIMLNKFTDSRLTGKFIWKWVKIFFHVHYKWKFLSQNPGAIMTLKA